MRYDRKQILFFCAGLLWGVALTFLGGLLYLRSHLILEMQAPADFDRIVNRVPSAVTSVDGWTVTREQCQLPKTLDGHPLAVFKLCNGDYAREMLEAEPSRKIASALPCSLAVYRKKDGKTFFTLRDNASLTGTFLQNELLGDKEQALLHDGDVITLGATSLIFRSARRNG